MAHTPQKIGLMGGTFNPIHLGHLRAAEEIAEKLELDQIHFVLAASPPHKDDGVLVSYGQRLDMLQLAVNDRPGFVASDLESHLPVPSYTINTITEFQNIWSGSQVFFLVGLDSFLSLPSWHMFRQLLAAVSFVVFARAGIEANFDSMAEMLCRDVHPQIFWDSQLHLFSGPDIKPVHFQSGGRLAISSTDLRQRLEMGASVRYLVPEPVRIYIEEKGLYNSSPKQ